jgi:tripartite ATP-independent transporter DctP family solute receptor
MLKNTLLIGALALGLITPVHAADYTFKFGHAASSKHITQTSLELFAKNVAEKTGGKVEIQVFGNRELGDDKQLVEGVQLGTIDGGLISSPTFPLAVGAIQFDALQLPFLFKDYDHLSAVLQGPAGQMLLDSLSDVDMKGLGFTDAGERHFLNRKHPVKTIADFAGLKTRIVPIPLHKQIWETIGVNPVGMPYGEIYSGLETGVIEAAEMNLSSIRAESLYQVGKDVTLTGHYFWPHVLVINKGLFDGMPPELQAAMVEAGHDLIGTAYGMTKADDEKAKAFLLENGVQIIELTDLPEMRAKLQPMVDEWAARDPRIKQVVDAARQGS